MTWQPVDHYHSIWPDKGIDNNRYKLTLKGINDQLMNWKKPIDDKYDGE